MAKYLVVYSYQDEKQPLIRNKSNHIVCCEEEDLNCDYLWDLCKVLCLTREYDQREGFVIENIVKLGELT